MKGNTPKINKDLIKKIADNLRLPISIECACKLSGISHQTYFNWIKRGKSPDEKEPLYSLFLYEATQALQECQKELVIKIAASDDWRAHAWLLERKFKDEWSKPEKLAIGGGIDRINITFGPPVNDAEVIDGQVIETKQLTSGVVDNGDNED